MHLPSRRPVHVALVVAVLAAAVAPGFASAMVEGKVVDRSGQPLPDDVKLVVKLIPFSNKSLFTYEQKVKKGKFFFGEIDPGEYVAQIVNDKYGIDALSLVVKDPKGKEIWSWQGRILKGMDPVKIPSPTGPKHTLDLTVTVATLAEIRDAYSKFLLATVAKALESGDMGAAEKKVNELLAENQKDPVGLTIRAFLFQQQTRTAEAEADLKAALEAAPNYGDAQYQLAELYVRSDRGDEALPLLAKVEASDADAARKAQATLLEAQVHRAKNMKNEAIVDLERASKYSDAIAMQVLPDLAALYTEVGRHADAEALVAKVEGGGDIQPAVFYNLAVSYFNREQYPQAIKFFEQAYQKDNTMVDALRNLGISYMKLEQNDKALDYLRKYVAAAPNAPDAPEMQKLVKFYADQQAKGEGKKK